MAKNHKTPSAPAPKAPPRRGRPRKPSKLVFDRTPMGATMPMNKRYKWLWATTRRRLLQQHGLVCMACGYVPPSARELEAHENYSYPGGGVIRLESIVLLCRKCHHTVHLERSLSLVWDSARKEFERRSGSDLQHLRGEKLKEMLVEMKQAKATYRADMMTHYCKVNRVSPEQAERDWLSAIPPEAAGLPRRGWAMMDYGPFEDEVWLAQQRKQRDDKYDEAEATMAAMEDLGS